jgi:hypothetical protein
MSEAGQSIELKKNGAQVQIANQDYQVPLMGWSSFPLLQWRMRDCKGCLVAGFATHVDGSDSGVVEER